MVSINDEKVKTIDVSFAGGLDTEHRANILTPDHVVQADNIEWLQGYGWKKRGGAELFNSTQIAVARVKGFYEYKNLPDAPESGTYTSQPAEAAANDTKISETNSTTNYETATTLTVQGYSGSAGRYRALIKFDLSGIGATAEVSSAVLYLYRSTYTGSGTVSVYRQKRAWSESQATWSIYSTGNSWQTAGGFGSSDCEQTNIGSLAISAASEYAFTLTASDVEDLIDATMTNNGFLLKLDDETASTSIAFHSSSATTASNRPKLVIQYETPDAGTTIIKEIAGASTVVYKSDNDGTFDDISGASSWADAPTWQFKTFNDDLCALPLGNDPVTWNGSEAAVAAFGSLPTADPGGYNCMEIHRGRLYLAYGSVLVTSDQDAHETFTGAGSPGNSVDTNIDPNDNDIIVALKSFYDPMIVFKEYSIHRWDGSSTSDFAVKPVYKGIGCISAKGVVQVGGDLVFVSRHGVHSLAMTEAYGDLEEKFLSYPIRSELVALLQPLSRNQASLEYNPDTDMLFLAIPVSGGTSYIYTYSFMAKKWARYPGIEAWSLGLRRSTSDNKRYVYYGSKDGYVYQLEDSLYTDNGTAISSTVKTPVLWGDDPFRKKCWLGMQVFYDPQGASSGDVTITAAIGTSTSKSITLTQTGTNSAEVDYFGIDKIGNFAQFTFAHSTDDYGVEIYAARVYYYDMERTTSLEGKT